MDRLSYALQWLLDADRGAADRLIPRWVFLRALGCIYFSAFFSLLFQIRALLAPSGILPAGEYLQAVAHTLGQVRGIWFAPTLLWFSSGPHILVTLCWIGMAASLLLALNVWPRGMLMICFVCFLSFVSAAQDFSGYQSDGMLLEAGFIALYFAPTGIRPRFGSASAPSRASLFLLQWEWFRIYFESGIAKIIGGDPQWRHFTAMDEYYQNGPLPTWIGWYFQHLPHWFHATTAVATLVLELILVWMLLLPRPWRILCFLIVTPWEMVVILTANYTFLNYLVLALGVLMLDDRFVLRLLPAALKKSFLAEAKLTGDRTETSKFSNPQLKIATLTLSGLILGWIFYATMAQLIWMFFPVPLPTTPVAAIEPFRIANRYGLFGVMTRARYEIEFQGSVDGKTWLTYKFRYKPQDLDKAPGIYAPYQPRFDWNLWFASLGSWREYPIVHRTEMRILSADKDVLDLFKGDPFPHEPPRQVRAVIWQYWFTTISEKRTQGLWWRRRYLGLYAPTIELHPDGTTRVVEWPTVGERE